MQIHEQPGPDNSRQTSILFVVRDPLGERANYQNVFTDIRAVSQIPGRGSEAYDGGHLLGQFLGTEAEAGISLVPADINKGVQWNIEQSIHVMHEEVAPSGGYAIVKATATTWGASDWDGGKLGDGRLFLRSVNYEVQQCRGDGTWGEPRSFGYSVGPPTGTVSNDLDTPYGFRAGKLTNVYGVPWPMLNRQP
jgi:hypothetical protein